MTRIFRGSAEPQMSCLGDYLVLLEHSDPGAVRARMSTNEYAILADGHRLR